MASGTIVQYFHNNKYSLNLAWSESEPSVANNTSKVTVVASLQSHSSSYSINSSATKNISITINGVTYSGTCTVGISGGATKTLFTASHTVTRNSDGNKSITISAVLGIAVTLSGTYYSSINATGIATLSMIARIATITSAPNFNDEETPTITYSNPAGFRVNTWLEINPTNTHLCIRENIGTGGSYTYELTDEERQALIQCCTKDTATIRFGMYTYNGTTLVGTDYKDRTFTIINGTPTLSPTVEDVNENTVALTGDSSILIRNHSNALVKSGGQVYKYATVKSQKVICGSKSLDDGTGTIEKVGSGDFIFSITDNRENTVTQAVKVPFIEYINLTCNLNANAPDAEGDVVFGISGNCFCGTFGAVDNAIKVFYRYRANNDDYSEWTEAENVTLKDDNTYTSEVSLSGLDYTKKYTFQAMSSDALMQIESMEKTVRTIPVFDWGEYDFNFNVPIYIKRTPLFELIYPIGSIYMSVDSTNPSELFGGEWELWGSGRVPIGVNASDSDFASVEKIGGEKTHKLTVSEIPSHTHIEHHLGTTTGNSNGWIGSIGSLSNAVNTGSTGGGAAHNNMPPYITCYMWKRIA